MNFAEFCGSYSRYFACFKGKPQYAPFAPIQFTAQSAAAQQVLACKLRWKLCDLAKEPGTNMLSLWTAGVGVDYDEWLWYMVHHEKLILIRCN